jgi:mono/diheme cytochrome c family protein
MDLPFEICRLNRVCRFAVAFLATLGGAAVSQAQPADQVPAASHPIDFAREIQPHFEQHCYECHGPKKQQGGLRLDQSAAALAGGNVGHDIVPGKSDESLLFRALAGSTKEVSRMPHKREPLPADKIALVKTWIDQGAKWPEANTASAAAARRHWAFRGPVRPAVPPVKDASWPQGDIDRFILARLEHEGLSPSPSAD